MKRLIALIALGMGAASLAQTLPPTASPVAKQVIANKKVVVHKKVRTHSHVRTVTRKPSPTGVGHTNVVAKQTVKTPNGVHTRVVTKTTTHKPVG